VGKPLEKWHMEDGEPERVKLRWILAKWVMRVEGGCSWLRIMSTDGLWYSVISVGF
jgi:hypothetical protein